MNSSDAFEPYLVQIAAYLMAKREAIFNGWRSRVNADASLHTAPSLTRAEFNNQVPMLLNILEKCLCGDTQSDELKAVARQHGLQRWQKGYKLAELLSELAHLHAVLDCELEKYWATQPDVNPLVLFQAYRIIGALMHEAVKDSVIQYDGFQRQEAAQRADDLERALSSLHELTHQRGDMLRQASHDLQSYFNLITAAGELLDKPDSDEEEAVVRQIWQRNLTNTTTLLTELMDLSRLEAGQEVLELTTFDGSALLVEVAQRIQPIAEHRQLGFEWTGPDTLPVEGDRIKVQRIVQNLLVNALKHTQSGWITLSWSQEDNFRWVISVQDSGPGLPQEVISRLGQHIAPKVESVGVFRKAPLQAEAIPEGSSSPGRPATRGEGIGLIIVKQLCELIGAELDIETLAGVGTIFRAILPIHYKSQS